MQTLINILSNDFNDITFTSGNTFMWSPQTKTIEYVPESIHESNGIWSLLHELGHAQLNHITYTDDLELLIMEVSAWKQAQVLAKNYNVTIDPQHIDTCLESYRAWLHKRSKCVECGTHSMQINHTTYQCHNCNTKWEVSASRLCKIRKKRVN